MYDPKRNKRKQCQNAYNKPEAVARRKEIEQNYRK